jgi:hypothetical protein
MQVRVRFAKSWQALVLGAGLLSCAKAEHAPTLGGDGITMPTTDASIVGDRCATPGQPGCSCDEVGAERECGKVVDRNGDYVTCSMGRTTCDGTLWGPCIGNRIVAQSLGGVELSGTGLKPLSTGVACTNVCDPNSCSSVQNSPTDVDSGGLLKNEGGISLAPGEAGVPGGPCTGLWCNVASCDGGTKTTISGTVYDPAGKNPLYNAFVYIPVSATAALPAFSSGATCDTCAGTGNISAIALAQTGPDGKFTLNTNVPSGTNIPLVVQMGKWRRKVTLPVVTSCAVNNVAATYTRLPKNRFDGDNLTADIPKMAIATGSADPFECLLLKAGIDASEVQIPGTAARIDYYVYNGVDRFPGGAPSGNTLTGTAATLNQYDVVLLPCEGAENAHNTNAANLVSYANIGGRVFTTHYGYVWLATPNSGTPQNLTTFYGTANWLNPLSPATDYRDPMTGTIDQTFPKGVAFAQWLVNVGASTTLGSLTVNEPRHNAKSAINPPSQRWVYGNSTSSSSVKPDMLLSMTFNTPTTAAAANQCGRVVFSDFHVSADALVASSSACNVDTDCGFTSVCTPPVIGACTPEGCVATSDCDDSGATCIGGIAGNCQPAVCLSTSDCSRGTCVSGQCRCTRDSHCGSGNSCNIPSYGTCSTRTCSSSSNCGASETCTLGVCVAKSCTSSCSSGGGTCVSGKCQCTGNSQCGSGTCNLPSYGTCDADSCGSTSDCGGSRTCTGAITGSCVHTCTNDTQCATAGTTCKAGLCLGCTSSNDCPGSSTTCVGGSPAACTQTSTMFPLTCRNGDLSAQEKALEFMLFDLTACVSPDSWTPPAPTTVYSPVSFTQDFSSTCGHGQHVVWREFDWQAQIPSTSSIAFSAQTANTTALLSSAQSVALATATTSTSLPSWDLALIDTKTGGAFPAASPAVVSKNYLRVTITLNPTTNQKASPTLSSWKVQYDCVDAE